MMSPRRILVEGGGGSGVPLAVRLAEAGHEVDLIEAGPDPAFITDPSLRDALRDARTVRASLPDGSLAWTYDAWLREDRPWRVARGRLLGGSTAVNGAYFQRPARGDFARWETDGGAEWGYSACLPALRRLEHDRDFPGSPIHGGSGPVPVERTGRGEPLTEAFLAGAGADGATLRADKNDGADEGVGLLPRNALAAERWGMWRAYGAAGPLPRLRVHADALAARVLIVRGAAAGVEVQRADGTRVVLDGDEVVLCAGAIETPRLLFASGIGDPDTLRSRGVPVHAAAPHVGAGLADHPAVDIGWRARPGMVAADPVAAWTAAWNAMLPGGEAVELLLAIAPTTSIVGAPASAGDALDLRVTLATPRSRGAVELGGRPALRYRYLDDAADAAALAAGVDLAARLLRGPAFRGIVADVDDPPAAPGAREDWVRERLGTSLHSCGTARMGPPGRGVVDPHGRVHGVAGLRVADASILPTVPSRGTALTAVMIGERMAELIAAEADSAG
ncbi:MAG: GMC family oxidoreductase N-terminal domain-containing protein [Microbacterium sp.]|uniref:GMC family oxidoreductase n=1 Tax=Microbacterium sp. TaxID=51671 RepID=UPI00262F6B12|nr:GMC family oxidoreductase N-terminal domain-containing protein [Microbacterium sp.]MCX6501048.1 GMC family oxidoreductase N-terminal domain-containing protein [Microbacterium sp.]